MDGADPGDHREAPNDGLGIPTGPVDPRSTSEWTVNWTGAGLLVAVSIVALVAWLALADGAGDDTSSLTSVDDVVETVGTSAPPPPSTTGVAVSTTIMPTTTAPTTTAPPDRQVLISAEMKPCRFGSDCLVASFTIQGFEQTSGQFFCIYPNSRREFSFQDGGKVDACLTADEGDTIVIEVDGVRSATVSEADLDGTP